MKVYLILKQPYNLLEFLPTRLILKLGEFRLVVAMSIQASKQMGLKDEESLLSGCLEKMTNHLPRSKRRAHF